jgi:mRNA interferase MazF
MTRPINRGEIWLINFDPTVGAEIRKPRPAVIISNDQNNRHSLTVTVLPVTDKGEGVFPFEVFLPKETEGLKKDSKIKCQQIRTIDKARLIKMLGRIDAILFLDVQRALDLHLGF